MLSDVADSEVYTKDNFILNKTTPNSLICTWSPYLLTRFIEMWKVKGKVSLKIQNVEALPARYLRRLVLNIRDSIVLIEPDFILHEESIYCSTINATTAGWELDTYMFEELKTLLRAASLTVGKQFNLDSLTYASTRNNLFDILHSDEFSKKDLEINKTFPAAEEVTQVMFDKLFNQRKTAVKKLYTLSKDAIRAEVSTWPSMVFVNLLSAMRDNITQAEKYNFVLLTSQELRSQILSKLQELQENQLPESYKVKDERKGFFSRYTMDWEINGMTDKDAHDILFQIQQTKVIGAVNIDTLDDTKNSLKIARDTLKANENEGFFDIQHINAQRVLMKKNEYSHIAQETDALNPSDLATYRKLCDSLVSFIKYNKLDVLEQFGSIRMR